MGGCAQMTNSHYQCPKTAGAVGAKIELNGVIFGNRLFYFQTNRERKLENKKCGRKKGFLSFYSVCMFCVCICVFVCLLALYRRHRLTQEAEISTQIPICEYLKMVSFTFLNFCLFLELFPFFIFYNFLYFKAASQHIMKTNTPN